MKRVVQRVIVPLILLILLLVGYLLVDATIHDYSPEEREALSCLAGNPDQKVLPDTLTLISWNLGYAGLGAEMDFFYDGGQRVRPEEDYFNTCQADIMEQLRSMRGADFVLLQEVDRQAKRSYYSDQVSRIAELFGDHCAHYGENYRVKFVPVPMGRPMGRVASGIMTISPYTAESSDRISLPGSFAWPTRLFMLDRCIIQNIYPLANGKKLVLINLHNSAFDETGALREAEMGKIRDLMTRAYADGHYVIAGGDWNINPPGFQPKLIERDSVFTITHREGTADFPDGWQWVWDPRAPTNRDVSVSFTPGTTGTTILDFYLISPNVELLQVNTTHLGFLSSDHHPVRMQVVLKTEVP
jgi:endonuclease/exonuclease/phosphatase family metal-dependent hydrolase